MDAREKWVKAAETLADQMSFSDSCSLLYSGAKGVNYEAEFMTKRAELFAHLRTTPEGFALVPVGMAALHTNMKTTTSTQPDWHDAPTCAGWWACFEENGGRNVYNVTFPDASWCDGSRYYGPIPPDPKESGG